MAWIELDNINFSSNVLDDIRRDSLAKTPEESCGLLVLSEPNIVTVYPCRNLAVEKEYNFLIAPSDYTKAARAGSIVGMYHSHTQLDSLPFFSMRDNLISHNHHLYMVLYLVLEDKFLFLHPKQTATKYVGRKFQFGTSDCLSLVEDFYKNEFHILLPKKSRSDSTMTDNPYLIVDNIMFFGFRRIDNDEPKKYGDVIICKGLKSPSHLMIYLGQNQILHHRYNKYSNIETYGPLHKQQTYCTVRHQLLWN